MSQEIEAQLFKEIWSNISLYIPLEFELPACQDLIDIFDQHGCKVRECWCDKFPIIEKADRRFHWFQYSLLLD